MPEKTPYLTVLIPTYNRARYLPEALDSVLNQADAEDIDYEVIVVDDGSDDDTVEILERDYTDSVRLIKLAHSGWPAVVRNAGMREARGELIAFQDSDDVWVEDKLKSQLPDFDNPQVVLSYGNCDYITADSQIEPEKTAIDNAIPPQGYAFMQKISRMAAPTPTPSVIIRRSVMDEIGLFNEKLRIATDTDYFIRIATLGDYSYCDKVLVHMRRDGSNISARPDETGDEAFYTHELNRIDMFSHLRDELELDDEEREALEFRIAELKRDVADVAARLGKDVPFDPPSRKLPPKPHSLREIEDLYDATIAYGRLDNLLKTLLGWWPWLYVRLKRLARKAYRLMWRRA